MRFSKNIGFLLLALLVWLSGCASVPSASTTSQSGSVAQVSPQSVATPLESRTEKSPAQSNLLSTSQYKVPNGYLLLTPAQLKTLLDQARAQTLTQGSLLKQSDYLVLTKTQYRDQVAAAVNQAVDQSVKIVRTSDAAKIGEVELQRNIGVGWGVLATAVLILLSIHH